MVVERIRNDSEGDPWWYDIKGPWGVNCYDPKGRSVGKDHDDYMTYGSISLDE